MNKSPSLIRKIITRAALSVAIAMGIYLMVATVLIVSNSDPAPAEGAEPLAFGELRAATSGLPELQTYQARDGNALTYRTYGSRSDQVLILLHGSGWHSAYLAPLARQLATATPVQVVTPDLRGHGNDPERRGDIDYIGQLEDDLADLIAHIRHSRPNASLIIGGHSSGGGLALRFAESGYGHQADAYVLLAPWLQYDAPTIRPDGSSWATPYIRRIIGLSLLNRVGITTFNGLPVIRFDMPETVRDGTETLRYSFRLNTGYAPRDYRKALRAINQPLLVLVGTDDGLFLPGQFEPVMARYTDADVRLLEGTSHLGIVVDDKVPSAIARWLETNGM